MTKIRTIVALSATMLALQLTAQDADELAAKMLRFASDQVEMRRLADNAYDFARRTFSIEAHIIQLAALYRSITDPPGA